MTIAVNIQHGDENGDRDLIVTIHNKGGDGPDTVRSGETLKPGCETIVYVHSTQYVTVSEVQPTEAGNVPHP